MKTGPSRNSNSAVLVSYTSEPVTSPGIRSGVNWTRLKSRSSAARERPDEQRLGDAGDALQQHVAAAEQRDDQAGHHGVLADDRLGDLAAQRRQRRTGLLARRRVSSGTALGAAAPERPCRGTSSFASSTGWFKTGVPAFPGRRGRRLSAMSPASSKGAGPYSAAPTYVCVVAVCGRRRRSRSPARQDGSGARCGAARAAGRGVRAPPSAARRRRRSRARPRAVEAGAALDGLGGAYDDRQRLRHDGPEAPGPPQRHQHHGDEQLQHGQLDARTAQIGERLWPAPPPCLGQVRNQPHHRRPPAAPTRFMASAALPSSARRPLVAGGRSRAR